MSVERPITTENIGAIVNEDCSMQNVQDSHINLFYIMVQKENEGIYLDIFSELKPLPGDWRQVEPQETWPDTFLGYFPKMNIFETEREREVRLNREVRIRLKGNLEQKVKPTKVHVLLARACRYT